MGSVMRLSGRSVIYPRATPQPATDDVMCVDAHTPRFGCSTNVLRRAHDPVSLIGDATGGFVPWRSTG
jgi:hypothetical protein